MGGKIPWVEFHLDHKWTRVRLRGESLANNDDLNLNKEGERIKTRVFTWRCQMDHVRY